MLKLKCPKHPRSNGINPKANCQICITLMSIRTMAFANHVDVVERKVVQGE